MSLYGLKQSGHMWYNYLSKYLLKKGYNNDLICPCVYIKKSESNFAIIGMYVDDLSIKWTLREIPKTINYLKKEFEIKNKILSRSTSRAFSKWDSHSLVNLHIECPWNNYSKYLTIFRPY